MNEDLVWLEISRQIGLAIGCKFEITDYHSIGGGCINRSYLVNNRFRNPYFVKTNQANLIEMFAAEAQGLTEIAATNTIAVPTPICWGITGETSYLVLEYLDLTERLHSPKNWMQMGRNLANLHLHPIVSTPKFGWHIDNTIGSNRQINTWENDWATFFTNHRIGYQLQLAQRKGGKFSHAVKLLDTIPQILENHHPKPAIVHGDLWGGNASFTNNDPAIPVIFDPATYWGDREVDIAMTQLFGGFPAAFYQGYAAVYPLAPGSDRRQILYNLYHILNHYNLFGGSYQSQANRSIDLLLS